MLGRFFVIGLALAVLPGCAAVAVVGGTASLVGSAVGVTVGAAGTAVDLIIPDGEEEEDE